MEVVMENVRQYILALKEAGKFSSKDISDISGVPLETVKNILTGKTSKNAGFATIARMITALGGDLNEAVGYEKKKEAEVNSIVSIKESYEMRIEEIKSFYDLRVADVHNCCDKRIADMRQTCDKLLELLANK